MTDTFEFTLNNPLTEEQWDMITDVDFDRTDRITFHTKHGKEVEFIKVIRCYECKYFTEFEKGFSSDWDGSCRYWNTHSTVYSNFCGCAARMDEDERD